MGMEEKYQPTPEEMEKAEKMVTRSQKEIDRLYANRNELAIYQGFEGYPEDFEVQRHVMEKAKHGVDARDTFVSGTFKGSHVALQLRNLDGEATFHGALDDMPLSADQAKRLYDKLSPLIRNEFAIQDALNSSSESLRTDIASEIREHAEIQEMDRQKYTEEKLKDIFNI